jgi:copper(I)-binding protein
MPSFRRTRSFVAALSIALPLPVFAGLIPAAAESPPRAPAVRAGGLVIERAWTRATPPGAQVAAGYLRVTNTGTAPDRLTDAAIEGARSAELHATVTENGVSRMRPITAGVELKPGETVELRPGGLHVMFMGLSAPLRPGAPLRGRLVFERAGAVEVSFEVQPMGAGPPVASGGGHHRH